MKYLVVSFILFFCTLQTFGQQDYFVYLQTDNNQAFYVRINKIIYSSTTSGYLILSKMADSTATVTIGFAKAAFPEQQFSIPLNHKDAGYLLKSFGDKGWGLFNLQTAAVIMNNNPTEEKKSPETTGNRKTDAFSLLLANAVNDTAVLYTVNKPKKIVPPPVMVPVEEKKPDSAMLVKENMTARDSNQLEGKIPAARDSSLAGNLHKPHKDSGALVKAHPAPLLNTNEKTKIRKPVADSTAIAKNKPAAAITDSAKKSVAVVNKPTLSRNIVAAQRKDTIIMSSGRQPAPAVVAAAKSKKERKDTIIIMKGKSTEDTKLLTKNDAAKKDGKVVKEIKKDSLQLVKQRVINKPAENKPSVPPAALPKQVNTVFVPIKTDTLSGNVSIQKDSAATLAKTESDVKPAGEKIDSVAYIAPPVKRMRPLVNKAAELLTDTSYVAVFVDESKDKFDTIRISIPFNEVLVHAGFEKTPPKEIQPVDTPVVAAKKIIDSLNNQAAPFITKKDQSTADTTARDSFKTTTAQQPILIPANKSPASVDQPTKDSLPAVMPPTLPATVNTANNNTDNKKKDSLEMASQPAPVVAKKDTAIAAVVTDSARAKAAAPPLFLNSDCKEVALDADIDKLRIKMLLMVTDEDKITLAKKVFKQKCFLTLQVKALSELFKTDDGKYKWFDAVYPFVSDSGNFYKLGELIKDDYYLNRFKAMLRN